MPAVSIMKSVREDMMFIDEVIGAGEVAIADERATEPSIRELAKLVTDTRMGGMSSKKAGVTHIHVGPGKRRLECLEDMLACDQYEIDASWLYPTERKGRLEVGADGDIFVVERDNFELVHVLAQSKRMVSDGEGAVREQFLEKSNRRIFLRGGEELDLTGIADINANQEPLEAGSPA